MTYINNDNEVFYDFNMITDILQIHPSYLKREIKKYGFAATEYQKYKNRHLYSQQAIVDFIVFLVTQKKQADTDSKKVAADKNENKQ